ncbi:MAG: hypothetical protein HP493_02755 [Nitrospira sp.]|nr:hypothetical protein [Nitrospira sp.]
MNHPDLEALLGAVPHELVQGIVKAVMIQDSSAALTVLANLMDQGHDLRAFCDGVVEQIRNLLVASVVPSTAELRGLIEASEEDIKQLATDAKPLTPEQLQELLTLFIQAEDSLRLSAHPRFVLETAAIRATRLLRRRDSGDPRLLQATPAPAGQKSPVRSEAIDSRSTASSTAPSVATSTSSGRTDPAASQPESKPVSRSQPKPGERPMPQRPPDQPTPKETTATPIAAITQPEAGQATLNWETIQNEIAASFPNIAPFLEAGRFLGIEGGLVTIGFAKHATLARTRLEKEEHLLALATLCQEQSGTPVRIRIVELAETDPPGPTMAQVRAAKEQDQRLVLLERARANPTVKQAIEIFGAELTEVRRVAQKEVTE